MLELSARGEGGTRPAALLRAAYCLLVSAVLLALCSRSSPLYPMNDWVDANCFFTVGKAMFNGRVPYRDLYEQKGVLLYFLYGLGWLLSHRSFLGVYMIEVLHFALFLGLSRRMARLFVGELASPTSTGICRATNGSNPLPPSSRGSFSSATISPSRRGCCFTPRR